MQQQSTLAGMKNGLNNLDQLVEHYYRLITSIYEEEISEVKISTKDFLIVYVDDNKIDLRLAFKEKNVVDMFIGNSMWCYKRTS